MSKIIRLTERDLTRIVRRVINEEENSNTDILATKLFNDQINIANTISKWFPNSFKQFKGWNDDEDGAVTYMKNTLWPPVATRINTVDKELIWVNDRKLWDVLSNNQEILKSIHNPPFAPNTDGNFYKKMYGSTLDDTYVFSIKNPINGSRTTFTINTDF